MAQELRPEGLIGNHVLDGEGQNVGKIKQVYLDDQTNEPSWVSIHTGLFGGRETLVPLQGAQPREEDIQVPYDKSTVKDSPNVDAGTHITVEQEDRVREYYARHTAVPDQRTGEGMSGGSDQGAAGITVPGEDVSGSTETAAHHHSSEQEEMSATAADGSEAMRWGADTRGAEARGETTGEAMGSGGSTGEAVGAPESGQASGDTTMIRSEEQVEVGVESREMGRARMRKYVETEQFDETVPVRHEELEVERRPVGEEAAQSTGRSRMGEEEETFTLYEERPVVSKEEVPVEEVHVRKRNVTRQEHVRGERRRERVEMEDEDDEPPMG